MARTPAGHNQRRPRPGPRRAPLLLVALALLTMPVTYGGGAETDHPHGFLQLWLDGAAGSTDHHRRWAERDEAAGHHTGHDAAAHAEPVETPGVAREARPDQPLLSELSGANERAAAIGAVAALFVWFLLARPPLVPADARIPRGLALRPMTPPPRAALP